MKRAVLPVLAFLAALGAALLYRRHTRPPAAVLVSWGDGLPHSGQWRNGFVLHDMDGDGHLDLVHGPTRKGPGVVNVFLHDGAGHFRPWSAARYPDRALDYGSVAVADFDGDGRPDLALGMHLLGLGLLTQPAPGVFQDASEQTGLPFGPQALSSRAVAAADWNGDGRMDLLVLSDGPRPGAPGGGVLGVKVFLGAPPGQRWTEQALRTPDNRFGDSIALGDFDGDGRVDLATGSNRMAEKALVDLNTAGGPRPLSVPLPGRALARAVAAADVNGDGRAELAVASSSPQAQGLQAELWLFSMRAGAFVGRALYSQPDASEVTALTFGDFNADHHLDLAAANAEGALLIFFGAGDGSFSPPQVLAPPLWRRGCRGYMLAAAPLDGRPGDELVGAFAGEDRTDGQCRSGGGLDVYSLAP